MVTETWEDNAIIYTICDKCSELLCHKIVTREVVVNNIPVDIKEIRIEACPCCSGEKHLDVIRKLLDCHDLNLDALEPATIEAIEEARDLLGDLYKCTL